MLQHCAAINKRRYKCIHFLIFSVNFYWLSSAINLTFFEKIGNFMVCSILMLMLQQYATTNKECTKHVTSDKQPLLTNTYYFQQFLCHFLKKNCDFNICSILMLMLQQHATTNKQWINCILFRIIIENIFLTINSSFIEIFWEKRLFLGFVAYLRKCSCIVQQQMKNLGARVDHEQIEVLRIPFL